MTAVTKSPLKVSLYGIDSDIKQFLQFWGGISENLTSNLVVQVEVQVAELGMQAWAGEGSHLQHPSKCVYLFKTLLYLLAVYIMNTAALPFNDIQSVCYE